MTLANVVRLNIYTTDIDTLLQHFTVLTERFEGERFALGTLLGVARLVSPQILVMLEATAMGPGGLPAGSEAEVRGQH